MSDSPGLLMASMQALEAELERLMVEWAASEAQLLRATREIERISAVKRLEFKHTLTGTKLTKEDLDAKVLTWLWEEHEPLMIQRLDAEVACVAHRVVEKVARPALSSKQSRLNADVKALGATINR